MRVAKIAFGGPCALGIALAAGSLLVLTTGGASADPRAASGCAPEFHEPLAAPGGPLPGAPGFDPSGADRPPPYLRDLDLAEDQQDKLFAILHSAAPAVREQAKAAWKARELLRSLSQSSAYSDEAAATIVQTAASAETKLSLLRARVDHEIYALLTPEQRPRLNAHGRDHDPRPGAPWRP